jgi:hypothetical protein
MGVAFSNPAAIQNKVGVALVQDSMAGIGKKAVYLVVLQVVVRNHIFFF